MNQDTLLELIKKNCKVKNINICDTMDGYEYSKDDDMQFFIDVLSTSESKAKRIADYLKTLGFDVEITDGYELLPYDDNHPEWLIINAYHFVD